MFLMWIPEKHFSVQVFVDCNKCRFWKMFVIFGNFDLFPVLENLFKVISSGGEFSNFLFQFFFHFK